MQNVASSVLGRCCALASSRLEPPDAGFLQFSAYQHRKFSGLQGKEEHRGAGINREHGFGLIVMLGMELPEFLPCSTCLFL